VSAGVRHRLLRPTLSPRERVLAWVALVVLVLLSADVVVGGPVTHVDTQVRDVLQPRGSGPWWLSAVGELGDLRYAVPVVGVVALVAAHYAWRVGPAAFSVGAFAAVELALLVAKAAVGRDGPGEWADREGYPGYFPSGHTATAMAVVCIALFVVGQTWRVRFLRDSVTCLGAGSVVGCLAGVHAVLADTHWASDVAGGLAVSTLVLIPGMAVWRVVDDATTT
jgi:undecaprenyl-diphosphatase